MTSSITRDLIKEVILELKIVKGVQAIALGGSRAKGTNYLKSDIDLILFYSPDEPINLEHLSVIVSQLDDSNRQNLLTPIGAWGQWLNGGGSFSINDFPVDLVYRDITLLEDTITASLNGNMDVSFQFGFPYGFINTIYLGELSFINPLWDPKNIIFKLKDKIYPYPITLQAAIIDKYLPEIKYSVNLVKKNIKREDITYSSIHICKSVNCLLQVLFAVNSEYWLGEKGALDISDHFSKKPNNFKKRINQIFHLQQGNDESIKTSIEIIEDLHDSLNKLIYG